MASEPDASLLRGRPVEAAIFGTDDDDEIRALVDAFCRAASGSGVRDLLFSRTSVGSVFGVELEDGRRVVVKAHQPRQRIEFLEVVFRTQSRLAHEGFPCPRPLFAPAPIGRGVATVEELVEDGQFADAHRPAVRRAMAQALARLIELARPLGRPPALRSSWSLWSGEGLWPPTAHSPIFDLAASAAGAEWIDELAAGARAAVPEGGDVAIVHGDWSAKHLRFDGAGRITVVYDWDSLGLLTEAKALGTAAGTFTANFELRVPYAPAPDEVSAFVDDYSDARATPLPPTERRAAHAVAMYVMAYTARCEHALGKRGDFTKALGRFGRAYLAR